MSKKYRFIQIILLITIVFTISGCVEKSTLTIINSTSITQNIIVDWNDVRLLSDEQFDTSFYLDDSIISPEEAKVRIEIPKHPWMQAKLYYVTLKPGKNKKIYLNFDRAGLEIRNNSEAYAGYNIIIYEVYYAKQDSEDWNEVVLETPIDSNTSRVISIPENHNIIKIVDLYGEEYTFQLEFTIGDTTTLNFTGLD
ncbi:MAG: hypothetical protein K8S23_06415 [Candidatus Cloacimonetes bacterium]|nr:hypothetical protein [Candidatus Cloacimonadota bacterium]